MENKRLASQKMRVLEYLRQGHSITPMEALKMFGAFRLSDIIFKLKKCGWQIETRMKRVGNKNFAEYTLNVGQQEKG